ncbi:Spo0B C-terminal domain-containing protein [Bacillus sp. 03113]|uniref:Spo0B C-terminal domain-containing protein n=1 Tax=Bacillus sp. 03113 TaxID=2578211 RepID=UPI00114226EE|nr:Spo0B C-terminal domain-containing protein [Bacillus sp. 03113]
MKKDWSTIELLRHSRHDWLNKLQLIKGNLDLNKMERAKEIIDEIVVEAIQESRLSNLNIPQFTSMLLTYNWENHSFQLEYEVLSEIKSQILDDDKITAWTKRFFSSLETSVKLYHENHLFISIEPRLDGTRFFFEFSGIIEKMENIEHFLCSESSIAMNIAIQEFSRQEIIFELLMD